MGQFDCRKIATDSTMVVIGVVVTFVFTGILMVMNLQRRSGSELQARSVKMIRCPFIFSALYMLKLNRSIADTSRQSYMTTGIRRHQNCRIGPSLSEWLKF